MEEGDEFYIRVLNRVLKYKVNQIKTVLPEETSDLRITRGKDYVTLVTCTPYSINTHRLLVRGERVEYDDSKYIVTGAKAIDLVGDNIFFLGYKIPYWAAILVITGFVGMVVFIVVFFVRRGKKKKKAAHAEAQSGGGG